MIILYDYTVSKNQLSPKNKMWQKTAPNDERSNLLVQPQVFILSTETLSRS
jgi:hypothetical protein